MERYQEARLPQVFQPALGLEFEGLREPRLCHLNVSKLALVAGEVVVENWLVGPARGNESKPCP